MKLILEVPWFSPFHIFLCLPCSLSLPFCLFSTATKYTEGETEIILQLIY